MSPEESDALARVTLGEWLFGRWTSGKSAEVCREQLLEAIDTRLAATMGDGVGRTNPPAK